MCDLPICPQKSSKTCFKDHLIYGMPKIILVAKNNLTLQETCLGDFCKKGLRDKSLKVTHWFHFLSNILSQKLLYSNF